MNDRQRCEVMFTARIMHVIATGGVSFKEEGAHERFVALATSALFEPVQDVTRDKANKLRERMERMARKTIIPECKVSKAEKMLLIGYHFINKLVEDEYLFIAENSPLRKVTDTLLEAVDMENEVAQKRFKKAEKQARKWLETLRSEGYFQ